MRQLLSACSVEIGVLVIDRTLRVTYMNQTAKVLLQTGSDGITGRLCCQVCCRSGKADGCSGRCKILAAFSSGAAVGETVLRCGNGEDIHAYILPCEHVGSGGGEVLVIFSSRLSSSSAGAVLSSSDEQIFDFEGFLTGSPAVCRLLSSFRLIAQADSTVLLTGETGTGKEVLARAIHRGSPRSSRPFVAINCGAFPDTLLESELFGYKAGAFTGANKDKPGRLALAAGGTLFLDEIGDISKAMQVRLLRVLQERCYEPLGGVTAEVADVRIVAATNRNLDDLVRQEVFRLDLLYRLNVIQLKLPPLRERGEDIRLLTNHFINKRNKVMHKSVVGVSHQVQEFFLQYDWPGNVRELENVVERAMVFCTGDLIECEHLDESFIARMTAAPGGASAGSGAMASFTQGAEYQLIQSVLQKCNGNCRLAAEQLGIHPSSLYRKLKAYNIK